MIVMNGISNPIDFGIPMFFIMEFLTIVIEYILGCFIIKKCYKVKELDGEDIFYIIVAINIASALFCFPFWGTLE